MFIFLEADPGCIMEELYKMWVPKLTDTHQGLGVWLSVEYLHGLSEALFDPQVKKPLGKESVAQCLHWTPFLRGLLRVSFGTGWSPVDGSWKRQRFSTGSPCPQPSC